MRDKQGYTVSCFTSISIISRPFKEEHRDVPAFVCPLVTSNINWKGKTGTFAWLNILESNKCVHFNAPCSLLGEKGLFLLPFSPITQLIMLTDFAASNIHPDPGKILFLCENMEQSWFTCAKKRGSSGSKSERVSLPPQLCTGQHFPVHSTQNYYVRIWTKVGSSGSLKTKAALPQPSVAKKAECKIQSKRERRNDKRWHNGIGAFTFTSSYFSSPLFLHFEESVAIEF